jgi:type III secretion protein V
MQRLFFKDIFLSAFVLLIIAMLVVPLPTVLVDVLLCLNIAFSLLLLLVGLYLPDALALLSFPSILLLSTLFRLALNVASSRLILSRGDAGEVIEAFGTFMIRGEVLVGVIVFTVISIVNFIVIARGSARISEVAARFFLESLPGRQLAIDADLRAGLLTVEEASFKREDLRRESQLYGAMDGAMNFVKGDAMAGLFIIAVNIIGGLYMGLQVGMEVGEAVEKYTRLTIGDGLVTQIPAILTSVCAGVVVTRISSAKNTTLASDMFSQLLARPELLVATGIITIFLSLLPGIPFSVFGVCGLLIIMVGIVLLLHRAGYRDILLRKEINSISTPLPLPDDIKEEEAPLIIYLDRQTLFESYRLAVNEHQQWWGGFQNDVYMRTGLALPNLMIVPTVNIDANSYRVSIDGVDVLQGNVPPKSLVVECKASHLLALGIEVLDETDNVFSGSKATWVVDSPMIREMLSSARIRWWHFFQWIVLRVTYHVMNNPEEVISLADVHLMVKSVEKRLPGFFADAVDKNLVDLTVITKLVHDALKLGIGIRDFKSILEIFAAYCSRQKITQVEEIDHEDLLSLLRQIKRRHLLREVISSRQTVRAVTLSADSSELIHSMNSRVGSTLPVCNPDQLDSLMKAYEAIIIPIRSRGVFPIAILCPDDIRNRIEQIIRGFNHNEVVLCFDELDPQIRIEPIASW